MVEANHSRIPLIKECAAIIREGAEGRDPKRMRLERVKHEVRRRHLMRLATNEERGNPVKVAE